MRTIGTRVLRGVYTPEVDDKGVVQSWLGSLLDITERKQAELRLAALNERLEAEIERAHARTRPHLERLEGSARRFDLRRAISSASIRRGRKRSGGARRRSRALHVNELRHPDDAPHSPRRA